MKILRNIQIPSASGRTVSLDSYYMDDNLPKQVIVFAHGYKSFKDFGAYDLMSRFFARKGFLFIKFNMSHNGVVELDYTQITEPEIFRKNTIEKELHDIKAVCDWIGYCNEFADLNFEDKGINLIGHSRGAAEAILFGAESDAIKRVISWAAFNDFKDIWNTYYNLDEWKEKGFILRPNKFGVSELPLDYELYSNYLENQEMFNLKPAIKALEDRVLLIHGIEDHEVPYTHSVEMKRWNKQAKLDLIPGASHHFGNFHPYHFPFMPNDLQIIIEDTLSFINKKP